MFECKICNKQTSSQREMVGNQVCEKCFSLERPKIELTTLLIVFFASLLLAVLLVAVGIFIANFLCDEKDRYKATIALFTGLFTPVVILSVFFSSAYLCVAKSDQKTWDKKYLL